MLTEGHWPEQPVRLSTDCDPRVRPPYWSSGLTHVLSQVWCPALLNEHTTLLSGPMAYVGTKGLDGSRGLEGWP